jgi:Glycosyl hydrolase 36 superfamily, catalytic domain
MPLPRWQTNAATPNVPPFGVIESKIFKRHWKNTVGMGFGIVVDSMMMARRLVRPSVRNAASIPLPSHGLSCLAVRRQRELLPQWTNPTNNWFARHIKAYPPGIRENGGQYTHGAIWSVFAHAELNQAERALDLFQILNPINHSSTEADARTYRVEPYVIAADVYSMPPHVGRGGWTWYTGSAGWMYRAGLEAILGVTREGDMLRIKPCIPDDWGGYEITTQFGSTKYEIKLVRRESGADPSSPDVQILSPREFLISLKDGGGTCRIELSMAAHNS